MAALQGLAAYASDSDNDVLVVEPKRRKCGFFDAAEESSSEEEAAAGVEAAEPEPSHPPPGSAGSLPSFAELYETTQAPEFLKKTAQLAVLEAHVHAGQRTLHPLHGGGLHAVVGAAPKRYSEAEALQREALTALRREEAAAAVAALQKGRARGGGRDFASAAVAVEDMLANPSLNAPRQKQERKDREKVKRERGQSAITSWKSEAEMVLRQQYDS